MDLRGGGMHGACDVVAAFVCGGHGISYLHQFSGLLIIHLASYASFGT